MCHCYVLPFSRLVLSVQRAIYWRSTSVSVGVCILITQSCLVATWRPSRIVVCRTGRLASPVFQFSSPLPPNPHYNDNGEIRNTVQDDNESKPRRLFTEDKKRRGISDICAVLLLNETPTAPNLCSPQNYSILHELGQSFHSGRDAEGN